MGGAGVVALGGNSVYAEALGGAIGGGIASYFSLNEDDRSLFEFAKGAVVGAGGAATAGVSSKLFMGIVPPAPKILSIAGHVSVSESPVILSVAGHLSNGIFSTATDMFMQIHGANLMSKLFPPCKDEWDEFSDYAANHSGVSRRKSFF